MSTVLRSPAGAESTRCSTCGWTYGTHAPDCCAECRDYDREHDRHCRFHPDHDPTPRGCAWCGAYPCRCPPIADND